MSARRRTSEAGGASSRASVRATISRCAAATRMKTSLHSDNIVACRHPCVSSAGSRDSGLPRASFGRPENARAWELLRLLVENGDGSSARPTHFTSDRRRGAGGGTAAPPPEVLARTEGSTPMLLGSPALHQLHRQRFGREDSASAKMSVEIISKRQRLPLPAAFEQQTC